MKDKRRISSLQKKVVGVQGVVHLGQIQSGLRSAIRIVQVKYYVSINIVQVKNYTSIYCPGKKLCIYLLSR